MDLNKLLECIRVNDLELFKKTKQGLMLDLISKNLDIYINTDELLEMACQYGHLEIAKWIIDTEPSLWIIINNVEPALHYRAFIIACNNNRVNIVRWLLTLPGFNINVIEQIEQHPFITAAANNWLEMMIIIMDAAETLPSCIIADAFIAACEYDKQYAIKLILMTYDLLKTDYKTVVKGFIIAHKKNNMNVINVLNGLKKIENLN